MVLVGVVVVVVEVFSGAGSSGHPSTPLLVTTSGDDSSETMVHNPFIRRPLNGPFLVTVASAMTLAPSSWLGGCASNSAGGPSVADSGTTDTGADTRPDVLDAGSVRRILPVSGVLHDAQCPLWVRTRGPLVRWNLRASLCARRGNGPSPTAPPTGARRTDPNVECVECGYAGRVVVHRDTHATEDGQVPLEDRGDGPEASDATDALPQEEARGRSPGQRVRCNEPRAGHLPESAPSASVRSVVVGDARGPLSSGSAPRATIAERGPNDPRTERIAARARPVRPRSSAHASRALPVGTGASSVLPRCDPLGPRPRETLARSEAP